MSVPTADEIAETRARRLGVAGVLLGFILFSTSAPLVAGAELEGLAVAVWRAWIASATFAVVSAGYRKWSWHALKLTALPGVSFGLATGLFYEAAQRTSVANATLIAAMQPIPMVIAARFVFRERVGPGDVGWLSIALGGATFMILVADTGGTADFGGDLLAICSTLFTAGYFIFSRRARRTVDTTPFMAGLMFWGGVILTPMAAVAGQDLVTSDGSEWGRLVAVALIPGMGHLLINNAHRFVPLVVIGVMQLLLPVGSTVLAWWFLDQTLNGGQALGMAIVIGSLTAHTVYRARLPKASTAPAA